MPNVILDHCWNEVEPFMSAAEFMEWVDQIAELMRCLEDLRDVEVEQEHLSPLYDYATRFGYHMAERAVPLDVLLRAIAQFRKQAMPHLFRRLHREGHDLHVFDQVVVLSSIVSDYNNRIVCGYNQHQNDRLNRLYEMQRNVVLDALPFSVVVYDGSSRCVYANTTSYAEGVTPADVIGKLRAELVAAYNATPEPPDTWERLQQGKRIKTRIESLDEDGGLSTNDKELIPIHDEQGELAYVLSISYPSVSERERLYNLQKQFSFVLNSMNSGLLVLNQEHVIAAFNKKAEEIFGLSDDQVIGTSLDELFRGHIESDIKELDMLFEVMETGRQVRDTEYRLKMNGRTLVLRVSGNPIKNAKGVPVGYIIVLDDRTELLAMQEAMMRNEKFALIGQFAAGIAHEIRNPLTTVFGFLQLFASGAVKADNLLGLTQTLLIPEIERANIILSDFLMVSKPTAPQRTLVDTLTFFQDVVRLVESEAHLRGAILDVEVPKRLPKLLLDVQQMKQVFLNLCKNAFDVTPPGGRLQLRVLFEAADEPCVRFDVVDEGPGIDMTDLPRIFDPFYTTKEHGTGLGLPISHRIIEGHGGTLQVRSTEGEGTTFTIRIPMTRRS